MSPTDLIKEPHDKVEEVVFLLKRVEEYVLPAQRQEYMRQVRSPLMLWNERLQRRLELLNPSCLQVFMAALWWIIERGEEEELGLVRKIRLHPPFESNEIDELLEVAERRIAGRVNDPDYIVKSAEEAYLQHREKWQRRFGGQYIAVHHGQVLYADSDRLAIIARMIETEESVDCLAVSTSKVGGPTLEFRVIQALRAINAQLKQVFRPEAIGLWLNTQIPLFDGQTPIEMIQHGRADSVQQLLGWLEEGVHY